MIAHPISRRQAIIIGGLGVAGLASGAAGWLATCQSSSAGGRLQPAGAGVHLNQPPVLASHNGRVRVELTAGGGVHLAGRDTHALGFNGSSLGPTLRVRPGDELAVRLTNRLAQPTNLHLHGLRVSPQASGDNPFLRIDPGASFDYLHRIPTDHPPGTYWYHPHHHGTVAATPAAAQRWRIINGCTSRVLPIRLEGHQLIQIAHDGTFLPAPVPRNRIVLAPGNRADVIIRPAGERRYPLTAEAFERGGMGGMMGGGTATSAPVTLATLTCAGTPITPPSLPAALPAEAPPTGPVAVQRRIAFQMGMGMGGMSFTIDGRRFDPQRDDQTVTFGDIEEWTVTNTSPLAHPFHLHVWPFTVLAMSDASPPTGAPQDVVLIPARGWARLNIPFTTHVGRSVYHCHILDHEDAGMMATVNVRG